MFALSVERLSNGYACNGKRELSLLSSCFESNNELFRNE